MNCVSCESPVSPYNPWSGLYRASKSATDWEQKFSSLYSNTIVYLTPNGAKLSGIVNAGVGALEKGHSAYEDLDLDPATHSSWLDLACHKPAKARLIHSCCWSLLINHFTNDEVDLDRLFEVCMNRPTTRAQDFNGSFWRSREHPHLKPKIRLGNSTKKLWKIQHSKKSAKYDIIIGADCLSLLPMEIRLEIAAYLSTADFLSLRLISRGMAVIFSLQSFWKTRFRVNGDRGFLVCLTERPGKRTNWRSIYHCTATIDHSDLHLGAMRHRWRNNCWLRDRYLMTQAASGQHMSEENQLAKVAWKKAAARIYCDSVGWHRRHTCNCRPPVSQTIWLRDLVIGITVFILDEGTGREENRSHIIGLDLIRADAGVLTLGHRLPGSQVTIKFDGRHLRGFRINTGGGGIRGMQPIFDSGPIISWIGDSKPDGKRFRPILKGNIKAISAKFDVSHFRSSQPQTYANINMN